VINQIPTEGQARLPRALLMAGDTPIKWSAFSIDHNGIYEAGTISVTVVAEQFEWAWWMGQTEIVIDVYIGFVANPDDVSSASLPLLMTARMDDITLDPATSTITLTGRDLTSLFIDNKVNSDYRNLTASQIVAMLAAKFPILTTRITPTTTIAGNYYTQDTSVVHHQNTMWTLMSYLAQQEGMQCFVLGRELYFGKFGSTLSDAPYSIVYQAPNDEQDYPVINAERLKFSHDLTISGDVTVNVSSFHGAKNAAYHAKAHSTRTSKLLANSANVVQTAQEYHFTFPGLTLAQCQDRADLLLAQISQHEYKLDTTVPGDTVTFPWTPIAVSGTGTPFDTTYQIAHISRTFDRRGFLQTISARTAPPPQEVKLS
jgi:hypothetical protein